VVFDFLLVILIIIGDTKLKYITPEGNQIPQN